MIDNENNCNYFNYYLFVAFSAVLGFFILLGMTRASINISAEKGIVDLTNGMKLISFVVALIGTALFLFLSLLFKQFFIKIYFSEIFLYLYMGFLATAINIIAFKVFLNIFSKSQGAQGLGWKIAELGAFVVAVIFAFFTNKIFVFKSKDFTLKIMGVELFQFTIGRVVTEVINFLMMWIMIDIKNMNEMFTKVLASIVVIVLNYIFSKFIIFKKKNNVQV